MNQRGWLLLAALAVLWGVPYLFIRIAVADLAPAVVAWARIALGAAVLLPLAWRRGSLRGLRRRLGAITAYAVCEVVVPYPAISWGERLVSSSLSAIIVAGLPIVVAVLAIVRDRRAPLGIAHWAGLAIGLSGVIALVGIDIAGRASELPGALSILAATVAYAIAPVIVQKRLTAIDPLGSVAVALAIGTGLLTPPALASLPRAIPSAAAVGSIALLGIGCTAIALVVFLKLILEVGAERATVVAYLNPIVAVLLGVGLMGESLSAAAIAGIGLVLAGSWLTTRPGRLPGARRPEPSIRSIVPPGATDTALAA